MFDMDKERCIRFTPGKWIRHDFFLPAIAVASFLIFVRLVYFPWGECTIDWPSWVQAVGSVGAIGVAIWIAEKGRRHERKIAANAAVLEDYRVSQLAEQSVYECYLAMSKLSEHVAAARGLRVPKINAGRLNQAAEVLRAVLQQKLPTAVVDRVFSVLAHAGVVGVEISQADPVDSRQELEQILKAHVAAVRILYEATYREYRRYAKKAGVSMPESPRL